MLSLFLLLVFSVLADEFDYNSAWRDVLDVVIPEVDAPDAEEVFPEPYLPGTIFDDNSGISVMSLFPEDISSSLASYKLDYYLYFQKLTSQSSSGKSDPFDWSSLSSPAYSIVVPELQIPNAKVDMTITQSSTYDGFLINQGDTVDVNISGIQYNLYLEAYSSADDEVPTVTEYYPARGSYTLLTSKIYGVDSVGVTRELTDYISDASSSVTGALSSMRTLNCKFRVNSCPFNIKELIITVFNSEVINTYGIALSSFNENRFWRARTGMRNGDIRILTVDTEGETVINIETNTQNIETNTKGIWDSIVSLPGAIMDGIIGLFVPDDGFWDEYYAKYDLLLSENLGFLYESFHLLYELFETVMSGSSSMNTVEVPYFSYDFSGTTFEFGGWEVNLVPEGMEILQDICRSISSIIMIIMIINFGMKMYDKILHL